MVQVSLCEYLDAVAIRGRSISAVVGRTREPPLADVLTEGVALLMDGMRRTSRLRDLDLSISSERVVRLEGGGSIKPDVSIWRAGRLVAVIECKTNLGYSRTEWQQKYEERVSILSAGGLSATAVFLVVATETNWGGFPLDVRTGRQWLALCERGTWFGGGKSREVPLSRGPRSGSIAALVTGVEAAARSVELA